MGETRQRPSVRQGCLFAGRGAESAPRSSLQQGGSGPERAAGAFATVTLVAVVTLGLFGLAVGAAPVTFFDGSCRNYATSSTQHVRALRGGSSTLASETCFVGPANWAQTAEGQRQRQGLRLRPWQEPPARISCAARRPAERSMCATVRQERVFLPVPAAPQKALQRRGVRRDAAGVRLGHYGRVRPSPPQLSAGGAGCQHDAPSAPSTPRPGRGSRGAARSKRKLYGTLAAQMPAIADAGVPRAPPRRPPGAPARPRWLTAGRAAFSPTPTMVA
jgi:hypothetical protein